MSTPLYAFSRNDVSGAGRGPADRGDRCGDVYAVVCVRDGRGARRVRADQVAFDQAGRRIDVKAVLRVSRDDVGGAGDGPADRGARTRGVNVNAAVTAVRHRGGARRIRADIVALDQARRRIDVDTKVRVSREDVGGPVVVPPTVAPDASTTTPDALPSAVPEALIPSQQPTTPSPVLDVDEMYMP